MLIQNPGLIFPLGTTPPCASDNKIYEAASFVQYGTYVENKQYSLSDFIGDCLSREKSGEALRKRAKVRLDNILSSDGKAGERIYKFVLEEIDNL